jgi:hypothetical protein
MRITLALLLCALALPVMAQEVEAVLLPIEPSVVMCAYNSRFETRLVVYNQNGHSVRAACAGDVCGSFGVEEGREIAGVQKAVPLPTFLYLPKNDVDRMRMSLVVEASDRDHLDDRSYTELPIARASDFSDKTISIVGVRMDPGFRQTLRIFGLDGNTFGEVMVRAYDLKTGWMLYEEPHWLWPLSDEQTASGQALRPSFTMECDLSAELPEYLDGRNVRVELEPMTEGLKFWAFVSITNNKTQGFYTITPR